MRGTGMETPQSPLTCPVCGSDKVVFNSEGLPVCSNCGYVFPQEMAYLGSAEYKYSAMSHSRGVPERDITAVFAPEARLSASRIFSHPKIAKRKIAYDNVAFVTTFVIDEVKRILQTLGWVGKDLNQTKAMISSVSEMMVRCIFDKIKDLGMRFNRSRVEYVALRVIAVLNHLGYVVAPTSDDVMKLRWGPTINRMFAMPCIECMRKAMKIFKSDANVIYENVKTVLNKRKKVVSGNGGRILSDAVIHYLAKAISELNLPEMTAAETKILRLAKSFRPAAAVIRADKMYIPEGIEIKKKMIKMQKAIAVGLWRDLSPFDFMYLNILSLRRNSEFEAEVPKKFAWLMDDRTFRVATVKAITGAYNVAILPYFAIAGELKRGPIVDVVKDIAKDRGDMEKVTVMGRDAIFVSLESLSRGMATAMTVGGMIVLKALTDIRSLNIRKLINPADVGRAYRKIKRILGEKAEEVYEQVREYIEEKAGLKSAKLIPYYVANG